MATNRIISVKRPSEVPMNYTFHFLATHKDTLQTWAMENNVHKVYWAKKRGVAYIDETIGAHLQFNLCEKCGRRIFQSACPDVNCQGRGLPE